MSDQEDENQHNNEEYAENYEENENMEGMNQNEEEYEEENMNENGEEEEGQDVYAFDIQINDDSYLLVIGKTDENKLLLRLIDKVDETKPFFQNEFSLEDLRNINEFFHRIDDENIAYQFIISNLNEAEKEIKILDQEKIKLKIVLTYEDEKIVIDFILFKTINDSEGNEEEGNQEEVLMNNNNEQIENEGELEEGVEMMENIMSGGHGEMKMKRKEYRNDDNNKDKKSNEALSSNLPLQLDSAQHNLNSKSIEKKEISKKNVNGVETIIEKKEITKISSNPQHEEKKEITIITENKRDSNINKNKRNENEKYKENLRLSNQSSNKKETQKIIFNNDNDDDNNEQNNNEEKISLLKEELTRTINSLSENFNNQLMKQNESFLKMQKDLKEENEKKIKEIKNELNKKDNELNEMKNIHEKFNNKISEIEQNIKDNKKTLNNFEGKLNDITKKMDDINGKINNINVKINEEIEKNNKNIKNELQNLSKQMEEKIKLRQSMEKEKEKEKDNINPQEIIDKNIYEQTINEIENKLIEIQKDLENNKNDNITNLNEINEKMNNLDKKIEKNGNILLDMEKDNNTNFNKNNKDKENINNKINKIENDINNFNTIIQNLEETLKNNKPKENDSDNINNDKLSVIENTVTICNSKLKNLEDLMNANKTLNEMDNKNNEKLINDKISNFGKKIDAFDSKIQTLENKILNITLSNTINEQNIPTQKSEVDFTHYDEKLNELENIIKNVDTKINDYEFDQMVQNISLLMEKNQNNNDTNEKLNNIQNEINEIHEKINNNEKKNMDLRKISENKNNEDINNDLIDKINNIDNIINIYQTKFQKIDEEKKNNTNYKNNADKRAEKLEKRIAIVSKQSDDLEIKTDQLLTMIKNLESTTKELNKKTDEIISNVSKISTPKETYNFPNYPNTNKNSEKLRNYKKNIISGGGSEKAKNIYIDMNNDINNNKGLFTQKNLYSNSNANNNNNLIDINNGYLMMNRKEIANTNTNTNTNANTNNKHIIPNIKGYGTSDHNYIDSKIVNFEDIIFLRNRIKEIHPKINTINFNLVYRASEDGDKAADFHNKCDKIGPNITLIKTKKGYVFGGFTFKNWEHMPRDIDVNKPNLGSASRDSRAFGFCVNNQKIYNNEKPNEFAIWCNRNFGPTFKNNLFQIFDSCLRKGGYCSIKSNSHFGGQNYDYEISGGESRFRVEELEVYEVKLH